MRCCRTPRGQSFRSVPPIALLAAVHGIPHAARAGVSGMSGGHAGLALRWATIASIIGTVMASSSLLAATGEEE
jgi:hypothetical protein